MLSFRIPARAWFLCIAMFGGGIFFGFAAGSWIMPIYATVSRGTWAEVADIPVSMVFFAEAPRWIGPASDFYLTVLIGGPLLALLFGLVGAMSGWYGWRYLVVTKWKWITEEQLEIFEQHLR